MQIRKLATGALVGAAMMAAGSANAASTMYSNGYETDTAGWFTGPTDWSGAIVRETVADAGITPFEGSFYGRFTQTNEAGGLTGPFNREGRSDVFPGTYSARSAIFLDTSMGLGQGFDYSVASNGSDNAHQRDFIFHVTKDTSTGALLVGGSNNTNFNPREDLETLHNVEITSSDWYIFEHLFRDDGGVLAVDLNLYTSAGVLIFTETRSDPSDTIPGEVGGFRYAWFTNIDVDGGIAVDATSLMTADAAVPVPAALPLMLSVAGIFGGVAMRRRRARG
ncbi:MAG: hypothetical protein RIM80_07365 [Alphaproteobacteria bacterium]